MRHQVAFLPRVLDLGLRRWFCWHEAPASHLHCHKATHSHSLLMHLLFYLVFRKLLKSCACPAVSALLELGRGLKFFRMKDDVSIPLLPRKERMFRILIEF